MKVRVAASVAVTVLVSMALAGCQFLTPQQTARSYTPSDGVNATVGDIAIRNVFLLASADGGTASMIGVLANTGDTAQTVTLQWTSDSGAETKRVGVPADGLVSLSTDDAKVSAAVKSDSAAVILDGVDAMPGGLFPVTFTAADGDTSLRLPVLTGSFEQYATLVPTAPVPTATATLEPSGSSSPDAEIETPTPTPSGTTAG